MTPATWEKGPNHPGLAPGEIHLWLASIEELWPSVQIEDLAEVEQIRLETLKNEDVRKQFGVSHWMTRHVLARYLRIAPMELKFGLSAQGKPFLRNLEFNRSHSGDWIVLAICGETPVGVDIESKNRAVEMKAIVDRWFDPGERADFARLPVSEQTDYFFQAWTEKEAVLKAWGVGISHLSEYVEFKQKTWLKNLSLPPNLIGCVAVAASVDTDFQIFCYEV